MVGKGDYFFSFWVSAYFQWQLLLVSGRVDETWWNPKWTFPKAFESPYQLDPLKSWDKPEKPINLNWAVILWPLWNSWLVFMGSLFHGLWNTRHYNWVVVVIPYKWVFPSMVVPPNHPFLIGFSIIFTIHFGVPIFFGNTQSLKQPGSSITAQPATCPTAWAVRTTIAVPIVPIADHAFGGIDASKIHQFEYRRVDVYSKSCPYRILLWLVYSWK